MEPTKTALPKKACAVAISFLMAFYGIGVSAPAKAFADVETDSIGSGNSDPEMVGDQSDEDEENAPESSNAAIDFEEEPTSSDDLSSVPNSEDSEAADEGSGVNETFETSIPESTYYQNDEGEYAYIPDEALTLDDLSPEISLMSATARSVVELGGEDRYATVAKEALYAFDSCDTAVVASGLGYADSIAAAGLSGALNCPILLTNLSDVPTVTEQALKSLGVKHIVLLGSPDVADASAFNELASIVGSKDNVERVYGVDRYATQMAVYNYGKSHGLWSGDTAIISSATGFADALSISPVSYALKIPVFFCDESKTLPSAQKKALENDCKASKFLITGSTVVVSNAAEKYLKGIADSRGGYVKRLAGPDRYQTSMAIAEYAVKNLGFSWDGVAFASGQGPYDSLGGGVVQGKEKSVLLLADGTNSDSVNAITDNRGSVDSCLKFFGSSVVVPVNVRSKICGKLGFSYYRNTVTTDYGISLSRMADLQVARGEGISWSEFYSALDPDQYQYGTSEFYQFAELDHGWSGVTPSSMNTFVSNNCSWSEQSYGRKSNLVNQGSAFKQAAQSSGVNEVYLLAHAIWESGWGCSELAGGWTPDKDGEVIVNGVHYPYYKGTTYYNFYGIGAVDSNALAGGRAMAVKEGWTSPSKAITGAAEWIADNYLNRGYPGDQNTLYLMKWDVPGAAETGSAWHEYCTGLNSWVLGISRIMDNCYKAAGKSMESSGLKFNVPVYS